LGESSDVQGFVCVLQVYKSCLPKLCKRCVACPGVIPTQHTYLPATKTFSLKQSLNKVSRQHQEPLEKGRWLRQLLFAAGSVAKAMPGAAETFEDAASQADTGAWAMLRGG